MFCIAWFYKFAVMCILLCVVTPLYAVPPRLHVDGNKVKDPNGNIVILRGVALIDLGASGRLERRRTQCG